jgi:hypothetical protein
MVFIDFIVYEKVESIYLLWYKDGSRLSLIMKKKRFRLLNADL